MSDQVLFGDCRPMHRVAVRLAKGSGVRTHVFEEGYFRPHWVTLERDGVNANSLLPRDPEWFRAAAALLPTGFPGQAFSNPFSVRALHDVLYHLAGALNPVLFPGYRTHAPVNAAMQYLGYARRLPLLKLHARHDRALLQDLLERGARFFFLPLQLEGDAQIRYHSCFADMAAVMRHVMESFARNAPSGSSLLIKNHPLDLGLSGHAACAARLAADLGLEGRVHFVETGDLAAILKHAQGTVTVNSTVGSVALGEGCPTLCLADPIYNLPGLTFSAGLDAFWQESARPDAELFDCFKRTVIHVAQINGGFYSSEGIRLAVDNAVPHLLSEVSSLESMICRVSLGASRLASVLSAA